MPRAALPLLVLLVACASGGTRDPADNAAPTAPEIALSPPSPRTDDVLALQVLTEPVDADGDATQLEVAWLRDNVPQPELAGAWEVPASSTAKGQGWQVRVVAVDALGARSPEVRAQATITNTPPSVTLGTAPDPVTSVDDLALVVDAVDADGDGVEVLVTWRLDGNPAPTWEDHRTIPATELRRGQVWTARAEPSDVDGPGTPAELEVTVANAAPVAGAANLGPATVREADTLTATGSALDPEGDEVTLTWAWRVDGVLLSGPAADTLTGAWFDEGNVVTAELTPVDALGARGAPRTSNAVTVLNSAPTLDGATISPSAGHEGTVFSCLPMGLADPDPADAATLTTTWYVNGVARPPAATLDGSAFVRGNTISCVLTATDGEATSPARTSPTLTIGNAPPTLAGVSLGPAGATSATALVPVPGATADADGDVVSLRYAWLVDGQRLAATSSTLSPPAYRRGQSVVVEITPHDGRDAGTPVSSAPLVVANGPPVIVETAWSPAHANPHEDLTLQATVEDPDGDVVQRMYAWSVDGVPVPVTGPTLPKNRFVRGDVIEVSLHADDGAGGGDNATLSTTVGNAAPSAPGVTVEPADPLTGDDLLCELVSPGVDLDGDPVTHSFVWTVDGQPFADAVRDGDTSSVSYTDTRADEVWACHAVASDGALSTSGAPVAVEVQAVACGARAVDDDLGTCVCEPGTAWCDGSEVDCCELDPVAFDITIVRATIAATRPDGTDWDSVPLYWDPDPYVELRAAGVPWGSTPTVNDDRTPTWNHQLGDVALAAGQQLALRVYDDDAVIDEFIETLTVSYEALLPHVDGADLTLQGSSVTSLVLRIESP